MSPPESVVPQPDEPVGKESNPSELTITAKSDRPRPALSGTEREEVVIVAVDANALSNRPYSEGNWVSTQQLPTVPLVGAGLVGNLMLSPLLETGHSKVGNECATAIPTGDKLYRETAVGTNRDGASTHTAYLSSTQAGTFTSTQGGAYSTTQDASTQQGGTHTSAQTFQHSSGTGGVSTRIEADINSGLQVERQQVATLEVAPLPRTSTTISTHVSTDPSQAGGITVWSHPTEGLSYREELAQMSRRETDTRPLTGDTRHISGVGITDDSYVHTQSFATTRENAFQNSMWATKQSSRVDSRMSSTIMSSMTYPPRPDQVVVCWPPRVPMQTQSQSLVNADVERWKSNTANLTADNVHVVEVEVYHEHTVEKPKKEIVEVPVHVKVPRIVWVDKPMPQYRTEWTEVKQYKDQIVWEEKVVKVKQVKEVEKIFNTEKKVPQYVKKYVDVEKPYDVPRSVPVKTPWDLKRLKIHDIEKPTVVAQILKASLGETEEIAEVPLKEFVPELIPVIIQIPKPVSIQVWLGGIISTVHRQTTVTAAHWNSLVKLANLSVTNTEILPYMRDVHTEYIPFLPATERVEWVEPLSQEWKMTGWSHVVVPDGYMIRSLEILVSEFNQAREAELREAQLKAYAEAPPLVHARVGGGGGGGNVQFYESTSRAVVSAPHQTKQSHMEVQSTRIETSGLLAGAVSGVALNSTTSGFNPIFGAIREANSSAVTSSTQQRWTSQGSRDAVSGGARSGPNILLSDLPLLRQSEGQIVRSD